MADAWGMTGEDCPLFVEWLKLCKDAEWAEIIDTTHLKLDKHDALVVVDMQNDFIPVDDKNPSGGAFAVAEGGAICDLVVKLMEAFSSSGATVVATRDYHPEDHCSFVPEGGPFPPHCVQGSGGSEFYSTIGECAERLAKLHRPVEIVFKGFHEDIDSFGSFEYPTDYVESGRVSKRDVKERLHGCTLPAWTGCIKLKCSNLKNNINAPPDIMAIHRKENLGDLLKKKDIKRVFACGLAMDFCVLDTALNASSCGFFSEIYLVMDAARAAFIPNIGSYGTGFLSNPKEMKDKMKGKGVKVCPCSSVLSNLSAIDPLKFQLAGHKFPGQLGPWALVPAKEVTLEIDHAKNTYKANASKEDMDALAVHQVRPIGQIGPPTKLTLSAAQLKEIGIPQTATHFCWGYPLDDGSKMSEQARGYFSTTTASAAFFTFGGYVYLQDKKVLSVMATAVGQGLSFKLPVKWDSAYSAALQDRWKNVTFPFMINAGAKKFCWINPDEELQGGGKTWKATEHADHGAFVFLFHEDVGASDERDVFFAVAGTSKMEVTLGKLALSPDATSKALSGPGGAAQMSFAEALKGIEDVQQRLEKAAQKWGKPEV